MRPAVLLIGEIYEHGGRNHRALMQNEQGLQIPATRRPVLLGLWNTVAGRIAGTLKSLLEGIVNQIYI